MTMALCSPCPDKERPKEGASQYKSETAKVPKPPTSELASNEPQIGLPNAKIPKRGQEKQGNKDKTSREQKPDKEGDNRGAAQNQPETAKAPDPLTP